MNERIVVYSGKDEQLEKECVGIPLPQNLIERAKKRKLT
jgi:hypothetical protein